MFSTRGEIMADDKMNQNQGRSNIDKDDERKQNRGNQGSAGSSGSSGSSGSQGGNTQ